MNRIASLLIATFFALMSAAANAEFVFAHINERIMPIERGSKYEDPLDEFLRRKGIGEVTGGGSSLSAAGNLEWIGVDIELSAPQTNIEQVARKLKELGAPAGSFLEYHIGERKHTVPIR